MAPAASSLLRESTVSARATVEPVGYAVSLSESSSSDKLGVAITDLFVQLDNLILIHDIQAHADTLAASIEATIPDYEVKLFFWELDAKKSFSDWYADVTLPDGEDAWDALADVVEDSMGDAVESLGLAEGFNSSAISCLKNAAKAEAVDYMDEMNPFPGSVTDSDIAESATFSWSMTATISMNAGNFTIKQTDFPGWPDASPPSVSEWIDGINEYGFSSELFEITRSTVSLNVSAPGASWSTSGTISATAADDYGDWQPSGSISLNISF